MGSFSIKTATLLFLAVSVWAASGLPAQPKLPENLPAPPPIPPEILNRTPPTPPPDLPDPSELMEQLRQLEELLSMSPEKLRKLRQTIEIIENKSDAEREAMRIRLRQVTQMTDALREEINEFLAISPSLSKSDVTQFWLALEEGERESLRQQMADLPEAGKKELLVHRVSAFVERRDRVFREMRNSIESKK